MGNEASTKRGSSKKKHPSGRLSDVEGSDVCGNLNTGNNGFVNKGNGHMKNVVPTEIDDEEMNTELKKAPKDFVNEEKHLQNETEDDINDHTNTGKLSQLNNSSNKRSLCGEAPVKNINQESQSQSSGCITLRELAERASKSNNQTGAGENSTTAHNNQEESVLTTHDMIKIGLEEINSLERVEKEDSTLSTEQTVGKSPPQAGITNGTKDVMKDKQKSKIKSDKKNKDKKQKSDSKRKSVNSSNDNISSTEKESDGRVSITGKATDKTKTPKKTKVEKRQSTSSVSNDTRPEVHESSDIHGSSDSLNLRRERGLSVTSINISSASVDRSSSSVEQIGSGKKEKKKDKKSSSKTSLGSNEVKVKKRKKKAPSGTGSKDLPAPDPQPEKRRSIFEDDFIIDASLGDDNLEVVSLSSLSSVGDSVPSLDVKPVFNTEGISNKDNNIQKVQELQVSKEMTLATEESNKPFYGRLKEYSLINTDPIPAMSEEMRHPRLMLNFHHNKMFSSYASKPKTLIMRQKSDTVYSYCEPKQKIILTRPLSFEGTNSNGWKARQNSLSELFKRSTSVLSPSYRKRKDRETQKDDHPETSIVYI